MLLGGNQVQLLEGGDALFPALIEAVGGAAHEIWLATYIFHDDAAAEAIALSLAEAARRGVRVRVVVDGFGSHQALTRLQAWLVPEGVELAVFRPLTRWWNWLQPGQLRRLHQKLCVVDGSVAFVGGVNLIDDRHDLRHGWTDEPRLDFAVRLSGPVVVPVAQTLRSVWTRASLGHDWRGELLQVVRSAEPVRALRDLARRLRVPVPRQSVAAAVVPVRVAFVVRDNLRQRRAIERSLVEAFRHASRRIEVVTPYFYPGRGLRRALVQAARRGVRVRLLLQGKLDYQLAGLAARVLYGEMLAAGIEVHEYTPAFLHAKMALVDDDWVTVGSSNIDPLSLLLNLEANVVISDAPFAAQVAAVFDRAVAVSRRIDVPPLPPGLVGWGSRTMVASLARWYLRMAGFNERY